MVIKVNEPTNQVLVLCAGGPEPEPEFWPILPEPEPEFVHLR